MTRAAAIVAVTCDSAAVMAWRVKTGRSEPGACAIAAVPPAIHSTNRAMEYVYAGTERLKVELVKRRFVLQRNPEAYVFGSETGGSLKSFKRMWRELFRLAELDYGRAKGLTWHTIRHELVSRNLENTGVRS